jgi:Ferritin-like
MSGEKIFPRNLTARAASRVSGNPDISRPEDSVSNCFPGLDADVRSLDRRFFPGLVFEYLFNNDERAGAVLLYADPRAEPDLRPEYTLELDPTDRDWVERLRAPLLDQLTGDLGDQLAQDTWHLDFIEQAGTRLALSHLQADGSCKWLSGWRVWRLVRGLETGEITIGLLCRHSGSHVELTGWRRFYTEPRTGVISLAYQPGELQMSLCSPWQHDFRDCACHYWSSNRPDVVHGEVNPGLLDANPELATVRLDWMRADRSPSGAAAALSTIGANRQFQMDHFQINRTWQDLNIVLNNTEIGSVYEPATAVTAAPYASPYDLYCDLHDRLAPLEMTLALEYLYARFSVVTAPNQAWPDLADHAEFVRHYLLLTAVSEMQHLRAANELLWSLAESMPNMPPYTPVLQPGSDVPDGNQGTRPRALRPLTFEVVESFVAVEKPSGSINGAYARVVATLQQPEYPKHLSEIAARVVSDGMDHFACFSEIKSVLSLYGKAQPEPYLRPLIPGSQQQARAALNAYNKIIADLTSAYGWLARGDFARAAPLLADARLVMNVLLQEGDMLADKNIGVPFW